jgi:hypothetical protein
MRSILQIVATAGLISAGLCGPGRVGSVAAQEGSSITRSSRGGILVAGEGFRFEVFFFPTGARVFPTDGSGRPVDTSRLVGSATFYHPDAPSRPWFSRPLHPERTSGGLSPASLDLSIALARAPQKGAMVVFEIDGLGGRTGPTATFKVPLEFVAGSAPKPTAPEGRNSAEPRYIYGPGYYGYGYYAYPGPETVPQRAESTLSYQSALSLARTKAAISGRTVSHNRRAPPTGRDLPLALPWMRPKF